MGRFKLSRVPTTTFAAQRSSCVPNQRLKERRGSCKPWFLGSHSNRVLPLRLPGERSIGKGRISEIRVLVNPQIPAPPETLIAAVQPEWTEFFKACSIP